MTDPGRGNTSPNPRVPTLNAHRDTPWTFHGRGVYTWSSVRPSFATGRRRSAPLSCGQDEVAPPAGAAIQVVPGRWSP